MGSSTGQQAKMEHLHLWAFLRISAMWHNWKGWRGELLTIIEESCSPFESGVIWSLLFSSSDSSWGLVREMGEAGGGGKDRLKESPLVFTSSEMVSQGCWKGELLQSVGWKTASPATNAIMPSSYVHSELLGYQMNLENWNDFLRVSASWLALNYQLCF